MSASHREAMVTTGASAPQSDGPAPARSAALSTPSFLVADFVSLRLATLCGFVTVWLPSGLIIHDVSLHQKNNSTWAAPPSKPMINRDGIVLRDDNGKIRYSPIIEFASKKLRDRWSDAVVDALKAAFPTAFSDAESIR